MNNVKFWQESANESFADNGVRNNKFMFEVTEPQKDYLEEHMEELDEWCNNHVGKIPHTVRFDSFWTGVEDLYDCECYF